MRSSLTRCGDTAGIALTTGDSYGFDAGAMYAIVKREFDIPVQEKGVT
jgi:hypothetical protein